MVNIFDGGLERARRIQRERLLSIVEQCKDWGVLVLLEPPGDVSFLTPIAPALRGYEIVCADQDGSTFDVWRRKKTSMKPWKFSMPLSELQTWLQDNSPSEQEYTQHCAEWTADTLQFYKVPHRSVV